MKERFLFGFASIAFIAASLIMTLEAAAASSVGNRHERGMARMKALDAPAAEKVLKSLDDIAPDLARWTVDFAYGDVHSRPGLDIKSRQIATLGALIALANAQPQLKWHISASLNAGVKPEEIIETIYVMTIYSGFPAALNAVTAAREVFREKGIQFSPVRQYNPANRHERGLATVDQTSRGAGQTVINSLKDIAPDLADFIIDYSYGDINSRGGISPQHREIACVAGMTAVGTMKPQLKVHIKAAVNVGVSKEQIVETIMQMAVYAGFPAALNGISAAREAFAEIKQH